MALTNKLSAIGDAIREKTGKSELLTLDAMPLEIASITTGGGDIEVEPIVLSGSCEYACGGAIASKYIEAYGDSISTKDITNSIYMFYKCENETIPFDINFTDGTAVDMQNMFNDCKNLKQLPKMNNVYPSQTGSLYMNCYNLRELPEDFGVDWNWSYIRAQDYRSSSKQFYGCYSLRKIPETYLEVCYSGASSGYNQVTNTGFQYCYSLDEIKGINFSETKEITSNSFDASFENCARLKDLIFSTNEDGSPKTYKLKNQTINLSFSYSTSVGYLKNSYNKSYITNYNSGITADKEVKDDATYQALKNDPDWFSCNADYSRYNHDSAVNTINSLPNTSAYLATAGGTNTIKFQGDAGAKTDGGAINTMTEEEIAVATAKGWTVSMV